MSSASPASAIPVEEKFVEIVDGDDFSDIKSLSETLVFKSHVPVDEDSEHEFKAVQHAISAVHSITEHCKVRS